MAMQKRNFKFSMDEAQALSAMMKLDASGLGFDGGEAAPFAIIWNEDHIGDADHRSRFRLPSLFFDGEEIARAGFRNKDGFLLVRPGLPEEVEHACASRYKRLASIAKSNVAEHRRTLEHLEHEARKLFFEDLTTERGWPSRVHTEPNKLLMGMQAFFQNDPRVKFTSASNAVHVHLLSTTNACSLHIISAQWSFSRDTCNVMIDFPFSRPGDNGPGKVRAFVAACEQASRQRLTRKSGQTGDFHHLREAKLLEAVQQTDMGYM